MASNVKARRKKHLNRQKVLKDLNGMAPACCGWFQPLVQGQYYLLQELVPDMDMNFYGWP